MHIATEGGGLKNRAFTLIELLSVLVIIAVIALIATPIIFGIIGKTRKQAFVRSLDGIMEAVRIDYGIDGFYVPREYFYNQGDLTLIKLGEEVQDKEVGIKGKIDGNGFIYVDGDGIHIDNICNKEYCANGKEDNIIITPNEDGEVPEYDISDPKITLNGESVIYLGLNEVYTELGATAKTVGGKVLEYTKEIRVNGEIVTNVDTSIENTYTITYQTESNEKTASVTRTVIVVDMKPVVTMTEGNTKYVKEQEVLITVSAVRPNTVESFTIEIKKNGESIKTETVTDITKIILLNETGSYEVTVTVTDNNKHTSTISKTYKIDKEPPTIEFTREITLKANEVSGFEFENDETVKVSDNSNLVTWEVEGNLNTEVGDQTVTYIVTDEAGNEIRKERTFHITESDGPVINYSSASSNNIWIGAQDITIYARIEIENDELTTFKYQVDNEAEVMVPITNKQQMKTTVKLNTTGRHTIKITATGKYGNKTEETIGEFLIDVTVPVVGNISGNTDSWTTSKTLTATLTDSNSGVKYYAFIKDNATKPAESSADWKAVTVGSSYNFSQNITANGTYYLWAKDSVGNISAVKSVTVNKIDRDNPTAPTMNFSFGSWSAYTNNTWTNQSVYAGRSQSDQRPTGSTDATSGVAKYQISKDNKTWEDFNYVYSASDNMYSMHSEGTHTRYFRAVDQAGNVSPVVTKTAKIDKTKPTAGTANCNGSVCGTGWYTSDITVTAVNGSDTGGSGHKSTTVSTTRISNNTNGQTITVTTTDNAGNTQTRTYTVKLDKQKPTIANGSAAVTGITEKTSNAIPGSYFSITNYTTYSGAGTTSCIDTSNGNKAVTNTNSLSIGNHAIKCTVTRGNGLSANLTRTFTIKSAAISGTELATKDNLSLLAGGYRYRGSNPNNWVCFGSSTITDPTKCDANHKWRIIGIFDGEMKIIANYEYGQRAWTIAGDDNWFQGTLYSELNDVNATTNFYKNSSYIDETHRKYIINSSWSAGGPNRNTDITLMVANNYGKRSSTAKGYIGLLDIADVGNAGTVCSENAILNEVGNECFSNNWIGSYPSYWTINPSGLGSAWEVRSSGWLVRLNEKSDSRVFPVCYLDSSVKIMGGSGTSTSPYILGK